MIRELVRKDFEIITPGTLDQLGRFVEGAQGPIGFGKPEGVELGGFVDTPDKGYSAKAHAPVFWGEDPTGMDLWVICFQSGEGTGDSSAYQHGDLLVPEELSFTDKPDKVYPRSKKKALTEVGLPLSFTGICKNPNPDSDHHHLCTSNDSRKSTLWLLGVQEKAGVDTIAKLGEASFEVGAFTTAGGGPSERRYGDPHAIFYPGGGILDYIAAVGFIAATDPRHIPVLQSLSPINPYTT